MKTAMLVISVFASALAAAPAAAVTYPINADNIIKGDFHVKPGETTEKSVLVTSGTALIEGTLKGSCVADGADIIVTGKVLGSVVSVGKGKIITVRGTVSGGVVSYMGHVELYGETGHANIYNASLKLYPGYSVDQINAFDADIQAAPGAKINRAPVRQQTFTQFSRNMPSYFIYHHSANMVLAESLCEATGLGLTLLLPAVFMLRRMEGAAAALKAGVWQSIGYGILALVCCTALLYILDWSNSRMHAETAMLMWISLPLGIAALPVLLIGSGAFLRMIGDRLTALIKAQRPGPCAAVATGYLAMAALIITLLKVGNLTHDMPVMPVGIKISGIMTIAAGIMAALCVLAGAGAVLRCLANPLADE
jgi:hypothetical protein